MPDIRVHRPVDTGYSPRARQAFGSMLTEPRLAGATGRLKDDLALSTNLGPLAIRAIRSVFHDEARTVLAQGR